MDKVKKQRPYFKQKPIFYFDENFSVNVIHLLQNSHYKKKVKIINIPPNNKGKSDEFHFSFCKKNGYTLVTLDNDFISDRNFPFGNMPGIVIVKVSKKDENTIFNLLETFLDFISFIPLPKIFLGDSKFVLSKTGCVMWGKDAKTRELKKYHIIGGKTTVGEIREYFNY